MGYSIANGEIGQIGTTAVTEGVTEAVTLEIGGKTLHDVSYNEKVGANLNVGEHVALFLTPSRYIAALRRQDGEVVYASEDSREHLETPLSYPYFILMWLFGILLTPIGFGLVIIVKNIRLFTARRDIAEHMAVFKQAAI